MLGRRESGKPMDEMKRLSQEPAGAFLRPLARKVEERKFGDRDLGLRDSTPPRPSDEH